MAHIHYLLKNTAISNQIMMLQISLGPNKRRYKTNLRKYRVMPWWHGMVHFLVYLFVYMFFIYFILCWGVWGLGIWLWTQTLDFEKESIYHVCCMPTCLLPLFNLHFFTFLNQYIFFAWRPCGFLIRFFFFFPAIHLEIRASS